MIDIENKVITEITDAVEAGFLEDYPGLVVYDTDVEIPESFPCVTAVMTDNYTVQSTRQFGRLTENHASVTLNINVYTNNAVGKKELARAIFQTIDATVQNLNFTRLMAGPLPNVDRTVARFGARYSAVVGEPIIEIISETIDGETVETETYVYPVFKN